MRKQWKTWVGALVVVFFIVSCSSTAHIEKDDNTDLRQYKTYAWVDKDDKDNNRHNDLTEQKIKDAVNKELQKTAGWRETKNRPDVLLSYDVLVERTTKEQTEPVYSRPYTRVFYNPYTRRYSTIYYPSQFLGYDRDQRMVREGTITVTMIDAKTDKAVWQGWTTDEVNNRNLSAKEIQNAVRSIFRKFDVAKN